MAAAQNIESLSNVQLRTLLFGPNEHEGFIQATADYMNTLTATQSTEISNTIHILSLETDAQNELTTLTQQQTDKVAQDYQLQAEMQSHTSMPSWLSNLVSVFQFLASIITMDPVFVGVSAFGLIMQASGGQQAMINAACGDNANAKAAFEFGMAIGEAALAGGASLIKSTTQITQLGEEMGAAMATKMGEQFGKEMGQKFATLAFFLKNTLAYSGLTLMQNNFWTDFLQGPCGMDQTAALVVGMIVGMGGAMAAAKFTEENGLTQWFKGKTASGNIETLMRRANLLINLGAAGFETASALEYMQIGGEKNKLAQFIRNVMAPATSHLALYQGLMAGWIPIITTTQGNMTSLTGFAIAENQTFSALANMFKYPGQ